MTQFVIYRRSRVSADDSSVTLKLAESVMDLSTGESTVNVSVFWRILEL
jgi:hypothetical protein